MKKYKYLLFLLVFMIILTGCSKKEMTDSIKFKEEYESLNGKTNDNNKKYKTLNISEDNNIIYSSVDEIINILESGTGVIYFGFPECPWCRNAVPVLLDAADETGSDIYYFNALSIRDTKELDEDGNVITTKEGTDKYYKILELLGDNADIYSGLNDESIKRLYFPTVVFVLDGEVLYHHTGTLDSQEDPYISLTDDQKEELLNIYIDHMHEVLNDFCDESC